MTDQPYPYDMTVEDIITDITAAINAPALKTKKIRSALATTPFRTNEESIDICVALIKFKPAPIEENYLLNQLQGFAATTSEQQKQIFALHAILLTGRKATEVEPLLFKALEWNPNEAQTKSILRDIKRATITNGTLHAEAATKLKTMHTALNEHKWGLPGLAASAYVQGRTTKLASYCYCLRDAPPLAPSLTPNMLAYGERLTKHRDFSSTGTNILSTIATSRIDTYKNKAISLIDKHLDDKDCDTQALLKQFNVPEDKRPTDIHERKALIRSLLRT